MTSGNKFFALPSDWLATFSISVINSDNEHSFLLNKDVNFIREAFPDTDSGFFGKPEYYAIFDDETMILGPTPDANYSAELHYYFYPQSIVTAGNSWLGDNFDTVLFYGALLEAAAFMKEDPDTITMYMGRYNESLQLLKNLGDGKNRRDAYRSGQLRIPVGSG
tara:strand:- start:2062 stop:2553 length:492 start_codon:yes stop_codon:yes gene_type:complete